MFTNRFQRLAERLTADRENIVTRENAAVVLAGRISNEIRAQVFGQRADRRIYSKTDLFGCITLPFKRRANCV